MERLFLAVMLVGVLFGSTIHTRAAGTVTSDSFEELQGALEGGGEVFFEGDFTITFTDTLVIDTDVTIDGEDNTITLSGGDTVRLFEVSEEGSLTLKNLTLTGGSVIGDDGTNGIDGADHTLNGDDGTSGSAGSDASGGAVYNLGNLTLINCTVAANFVAGGNGGNGGNGGDGANQNGDAGNGRKGGGGLGGAIYNVGSLLLTNCTVSGNTTIGGDAGIGGVAGGGGGFPGRVGDGAAGGVASGAGIYNLGVAQIFSCTFSGNTGSGGNSTKGGTDISGEIGQNGDIGGSGLGGGIYSTGEVVVVNCTFALNTVAGGAGGDGGGGESDPGDGGNGGLASGGGIYSIGIAAVTNCTVATNALVGGANGLAGGGGASNGSPGQTQGRNIARGAGNFFLANSIIAGTNGNSFGTISNGGFNISSDATPAFAGKLGSTNNVNPILLSLTDNGGPTATMAIQVGSPAVDKITNITLEVDQRGMDRPINGTNDIGAYESEFVGAPQITEQPTNQVAPLSGSATFTVTAAGAPTLKYQWRLNGTNLPGATTSSYTVTTVTLTNTGPYSVRITNTFGAVTSVVAYVNLSPSILSQPTNITVLEGQPAIFRVNAVGDAPLHYQWRLDEEEIAGATGTNLTIAATVPTDEGAYTVVVTNNFGSVISQVAALTVNSKPVITQQPTSRTVVPGTNVTFIVIVFSDGPPQYQWQRNGTNLPGFSQAQTYSIDPVMLSDAGVYRVVVGNEFGQTFSAGATLTVVNPMSLNQPQFDGANFSFVFQSQTGVSYVVQFKNALADSIWMPLVTNLGTGGFLTNSVSVTNAPTRFFRAIAP